MSVSALQTMCRKSFRTLVHRICQVAYLKPKIAGYFRSPDSYGAVIGVVRDMVKEGAS